MKYLKLATLLTSVIVYSAPFTLQAQQNQFYLSPQLGSAKLTVESEYTLANQEVSSTNVEFGLAAGYKIGSNGFAEVVILRNDSVDFFEIGDTYNFNQTQVVLGYDFKLNEQFSFIPKAGLTFWQLKGSEGSFLRSSESARSSISDNDFYWQLGLNYKASDTINWQLGYANNNFDFGHNETTSLSVSFQF